uniref:ATP synthase F0 subunit 8 n=1 Tax=Kalophrynus palmatissimus TaxID=1035774 RepID=UPI00226CE22E|nr:ATP synthase F0 subunit 8 [Kalophrynus palmatissimus]UZC57481.1 ATP synthase F0 subunit 8 [Kalophrynus palmatissimus]
MPQLIPDPWFFIFFSSWIIISIVAPKKILSHKILNDPSPKPQKTQSTFWTWPWL